MQGSEASAGSKMVLTPSLEAFPYAYSWKDADVLSWCRVDVDGRESVKELDISTFVPKEANLSMFSSVQSLSHIRLFVTAWAACSMPYLPVHHQLLEFTQTYVHWVSDAIQPSYPVIPFSSHLQSFPASRAFQMSWLFPSAGQSIGVSASASVLPMNIQDWFPLGWTGWISLQSKGLARVFSNTTVQKHQFFIAQLSL